MSFYENVFIARQDLTQAQVEALADHFAGILEAQGGKVKNREFWGLRSLAYRIKKNRKGHYVYFTLDTPAPALLEMERNQHLHEDVLRHMSIRVEELEEGPSIMMRKRDDRDLPEREFRDGPPRRDDRKDDRLRPRGTASDELEGAVA